MPKCRSCNAEIVWLKSKKGKNIPVDADTYHGEELFDYTKHVAHFKTCPDADKFRKDKSCKSAKYYYASNDKNLLKAL